MWCKNDNQPNFYSIIKINQKIFFNNKSIFWKNIKLSRNYNYYSLTLAHKMLEVHYIINHSSIIVL